MDSAMPVPAASAAAVAAPVGEDLRPRIVRLPRLPSLLLQCPVLVLPPAEASHLDAEIAQLTAALGASNTAESVVARTIPSAARAQALGAVPTAAAAADGSSVPAAAADGSGETFRESDEALKAKQERLATLHKERAKTVSLGRLAQSKAGDVLARYFADLEQYVVSDPNLTQQDAEEAVELALRLFNAENFTGELSDPEVSHFRPLLSRFSHEDPLEERFVLRMLTVDGEVPSPVVALPALLLFCLGMMRLGFVAAPTTAAVAADGTAVLAPAPRVRSADAAVCFMPNNIWRLRVFFRHQLCLTARAHGVFVEVADCVDALLADDAMRANPRLLLEVGYVQCHYHKADLGAENFFAAMRLSGLELEEESMMGVRTRWQQFQVAQSVLKAKSTTNDGLTPSADEARDFPSPMTVEGERDGHDLFDFPRERADAAAIHGADHQVLSPLSATDKAIIMSLCLNIRNTNPSHGLVKHHIQTYLERLIVDPSPTCYAHRSFLLLLRARIERNRSRVAQRSFLQAQEIVDQFTTRRDPLLPTFYRTDSRTFYMVPYPSIWSLRSEFASFCFEDNLFKTALDLFEQVQDWENIIKCCKELDRRRRAENLAREMIETDPSNPVLWVALGEATREDKHLWHAWELSQHKMAAPMRALARLALEREEFQKVVEYFDLAVKINPVFGGDWFSLGYASLKLKDTNRGAAAFTRVCQIDPNDAYAWNNLGSLLLEQGKTRPAFNAIGQALRNNRRSWRMWQNYFAIGSELLEVTEATHALAITLEIGGRSATLDPSTMEKFVKGAIRYLKGEIHGSDNAHPSDEAFQPQHNSTGKQSMRSAATADASVAVKGALLADEAEDEAAAEQGGDMLECMDIAPLAADVEMPDSYFPAKEAKRREEEAALKQNILQRYQGRLKTVLQSTVDLFTNDADLYHCLALAHSAMDGPSAGFKYREKEYRVASQADQVYRKPEAFARLVQALAAMAEDATQMLQTATTTTTTTEASNEDMTTTAQPPKGFTSSSASSTVATGAGSSSSPAQQAAPSSEAQQKQRVKAAVDAIQTTMKHIDAAAECSAEHMEEHPGSRTLQILRKKLNGALKDANRRQ